MDERSNRYNEDDAARYGRDRYSSANRQRQHPTQGGFNEFTSRDDYSQFSGRPSVNSRRDEGSSRGTYESNRARTEQRYPRSSSARRSANRTVVPNTERDFDRQLERSNREATRRSRQQQDASRPSRPARASVDHAQSNASRRRAAAAGTSAGRDAARSRRASVERADYGEVRQMPTARRSRQQQGANAGHEQYSRDRYTSNRSSRRDQMAAPAPAKKKSKVLRNVLIGVAAVLACVAIGIGVYVNSISANLQEGVGDDVRAALVETEYSKEPFYMLLMGTDESEERNEEGTYGGSFRSDSMMLCRIDCAAKKVTLISLERDTLIDMGEYGVNKLNSAPMFGGAAYAIQVISEMAHNTPISHYAQVNFDGFCSIVDTLGGIYVDVPVEIDDYDAGGYVKAGPQLLHGDEALILCRSRNTYNDYGAGNSYRSANQRLVLSAIAQKLLSSDIATIARSVSTLSQFVTTDLGISDIIGIAQAMRGLDMSSDFYTAMQPTHSVYENEMWYNVTDEPDWKNMLDRVNKGLPPTEGDIVDATGTVLASTGSGEKIGGSSENIYATQKTGHVSVLNGGAPAGSGGAVGADMETIGYAVSVDSADKDYANTIVVFKDALRRQDAHQIANSIGVGKIVMNNGDYTFDGDFLVILGADYGN